MEKSKADGFPGESYRATLAVPGFLCVQEQ